VFKENHYDDPKDIALVDSNLFVVEKILSHKTTTGATLTNSNKATSLFKVKWLNYSDEECTDEPWSNIKTTFALHEYLKSINRTHLIPSQYQDDP
jgi:hypothetical protein